MPYESTLALHLIKCNKISVKVNIYVYQIYLNNPQFGHMKNMPIAAFKIKLAKRIRQLRKEAHLSQAQLVIGIGYKDKQIVSNYEINGANPTAYNLILIAKALNVTVDELLDFDKLEA